MQPILSCIIAVLYLAGCALGQGNWTTSPFNPPSLPLAVKSPYVNCWAPLGSGTIGSPAINNAWTRSGDAGMENLGWYAAIRVDGKPYTILALNDQIHVAIQEAFVFTPTRSSFTLLAGPVKVNMTFLSPIEATDLVRQSMPFSYLYINVESTDGNSHDVQIYADVTGEWISGDNTLDSDWSINESDDFVYLQMQLSSPSPYQEILSRPQDATLYHAMNKSNSNVSWQIGPTADLRGFFANGTGLDNSAEVGHHGIGFPFESLSIVRNLGNVSSTSEPIVYALGVVRDPVVQYVNSLNQKESRRAYYWANFSNIHDVIEDVVNHFEDALNASVSLDNKIMGDAGQISNDYADILALATRQAMGALEYTLVKENGAFNTSDVKAFMKDMGSIGSGGVNAVDVIYAAMPVYLYLNPAILGYLLSPLMEYQESTEYTNTYAAQDLGLAFPNATGDPVGHNQPIEHSASMLIMSLAHAQGSGDGSLLAQHYDLLNGWASYLVNNTLVPGSQTTSISDGITSTNQTNLALKGVIAIGAMAKISEFTGHSDDQKYYDGIAQQYAQHWTGLALASGSDQLSLNFRSGSSGLIYNLYADKLLQLSLINSSVYDVQASFYQQQTMLWEYGIPLDSSSVSSLSRSDWMMFAASSVTDTSTRNAMISQVHAYATINQDNLPFPVVYRPNNGSRTVGENSPAQGAMFAPLALSLPIQSFPSVSGGSAGGGASKQASDIPVIVGAAVGSVFGIAAVVGIMLCLFRQRALRTKEALKVPVPLDPPVFRSHQAPTRVLAITHPNTSGMHKSTLALQARNNTVNDDGTTPYSEAWITYMPSETRNGATISPTLVSGKRSAGFTWTERGQVPISRPQPLRADLRSEVDNLRREIERIRAERPGIDEPPPSYNEELIRALDS